MDATALILSRMEEKIDAMQTLLLAIADAIMDEGAEPEEITLDGDKAPAQRDATQSLD